MRQFLGNQNHNAAMSMNINNNQHTPEKTFITGAPMQTLGQNS